MKVETTGETKITLSKEEILEAVQQYIHHNCFNNEAVVPNDAGLTFHVPPGQYLVDPDELVVRYES